MILLTRLNGSTFVVNSDLIETIEATPDSVITLVTGKKLVVRESVAEILEKIVAFRNQTGAGSILIKTKENVENQEE